VGILNLLGLDLLFEAKHKIKMQEQVILVNELDEEIGLMEKLEAHQKGLLHRAFSVFIFNSNNELLLQQRALHKYHSAGLWTNTCCSHPKSGETNLEAANRRLKEEMGFSTDIKLLNSFIYKAEFDNSMIEHEFDYVFTGYFDGTPNINLDEVAHYKWMSIADVKSDIKTNPMLYTAWFKIAIDKFF